MLISFMNFWINLRRYLNGVCAACGGAKMLLGASGLTICPKCFLKRAVNHKG
jgi:hypothetical protein